MRLLLRANTHRQLDAGCREVAASPDTPGRGLWRWQVRLLDETCGPSHACLRQAHRVTESIGGGTTLEVAASPGTVTPVIGVVDPGAAPTVGREQDEIVVLLVCGGRALVEDRHLLADEDAMVLAGDDPLGVSVRRPPGSRARVAVVRLRPADGGAVTWVP